jgi:hypothetical protein
MAWDYERGAVMYDYSEFWMYLGVTLGWALMMYGFAVLGAWLKRK